MDILLAALILGVLGFILGFLINLVETYFHVEEDPYIEEVVNLLPRYNCGACGYPGCKELAIAILEKKINPSLCKPIKKEDLVILEKYIDDYFVKKQSI